MSCSKTDYNSQIEEVANFLNAYADKDVSLEGHTDSEGSDAYNDDLSKRRAESVKNVLIETWYVRHRDAFQDFSWCDVEHLLKGSESYPTTLQPAKSVRVTGWFLALLTHKKAQVEWLRLE